MYVLAAIPIAVVVGYFFSSHPTWNSSDGLHRFYGWPIPGLILEWEHEYKHWIDFPVPAAYLLNPLFYFTGILVILFIIRAFIRWLMHRRLAEQDAAANP